MNIIKRKIREWKRERENRLDRDIKEKIRDWKMNKLINRALKENSAIIYLKANNSQELNEIDYFDFWDLIYISGRFYPVPLIKRKNREIIKDKAWREEILVVSRAWYDEFNDFKHEYFEKMSSGNFYYPKRIVFIDEEDLYKLWENIED